MNRIEGEKVAGRDRKNRFGFGAGFVVDRDPPAAIGIDPIVAQEYLVAAQQQEAGLVGLGDDRGVNPDVAAVFDLQAGGLGIDRGDLANPQAGGVHGLERLRTTLDGKAFNYDIVMALDADAELAAWGE